MNEKRETKQETVWTEALEGREYEGGRATEPAPSSPRRKAKEDHRSLPPGYQAQPAWGFRDPTGHYEFSRVYKPAESTPNNMMKMSQLDEELSYWSVTRPMSGDSASRSGHDQWVSYAQAREQLGPPMTFKIFSAPLLTKEVRRLLNPGAPSPDGSETPGPGPLRTGTGPSRFVAALFKLLRSLRGGRVETERTSHVS